MLCRQLAGTGVYSARLRERVTTIDVESARTVALAMVPLRSLLAAADSDGVIRVASYAAPGGLANRFNVASGETVSAAAAVPVGGSGPPAYVHTGPRAAVRSLFTLNELHNELLVCCSADGAVRVWRGFAARGQQRLATAWQSVLLSPSSVVSPPCRLRLRVHRALFANSSEATLGLCLTLIGVPPCCHLPHRLRALRRPLPCAPSTIRSAHLAGARPGAYLRGI